MFTLPTPPVAGISSRRQGWRGREVGKLRGRVEALEAQAVEDK